MAGAPRQIGQRPGDFENPVMRAGGEIRFHHRLFEVTGTLGVELAMLSDLP
jgi:hypothetical protein